MKVIISYFDGVGCGMLALLRAGVKFSTYYASEIDPDAISVTKRAFPGMVTYIGDIKHAPSAAVMAPDLIIGGSPCKGFSKLGKRNGAKHPESRLFFDFSEQLQSARMVNPDVKFLLENVKMKNADRDLISGMLGVEPVCINSKHFSPMLRSRYYWTNIPLGPAPGTDSKKSLGAYLDNHVEGRFYDVPEEMQAFCDAEGANCGRAFRELRSQEAKRIRKEHREATGEDWCPYRGKELSLRPDFKMNCLTAGFTVKQHSVIDNLANARRTTPTEWERFMGIPEGHTDGFSDSARYRMIGNAWDVRVISWIFSHLK